MCCILRAYAFGTYRRMHCWWTCKSSGCDMLCLRSNSGIWNFRIHWRSNLGRMSCLHSWRTYYKVPYQGITIGCLIGALAGGLMGAMSSGDCSSVVCSAIAGCASGMEVNDGFPLPKLYPIKPTPIRKGLDPMLPIWIF